MYRNYNNYYPMVNQNEERFIGPLIPFLGGALVGYVVARPNFNSYYQPYYPPYYQYPSYPYYQSYTPYTTNYN